MLERAALKLKLNFRLMLRKGLGSPVIDVKVKKDSLLVDLLKFFGILAGRCGSVVVGERDSIFFLFLITETLSINRSTDLTVRPLTKGTTAMASE